ncbi:HemK2/MTQ2 family protein methyltransferase [Yinghuangia sp. YIM S09857]|uniref:HemK2/MTQ2 family protein methyltransferase n=1 Tax=Yinghuangia sp. YIM S09857 TaxID=3436929 RepID=UPI003F52B73A
MDLLRIPGVYRPQADTWLLVSAYLEQADLRDADSLLDVGTGTGAVALAAAEASGERCRVTAVDIARSAVWAARLNSLRFRRGVAVRRGDLLGAVAGRRFRVVLANPPYVPSRRHLAPRHGPARSWDAGTDGRVVLDRLCDGVPGALKPGGTVLIVHSALCGVGATLRRLSAAGLRARVVARRREPFGPVLTERAPYLEEAGLIEPGCREEELVVVRGDARSG